MDDQIRELTTRIVVAYLSGNRLDASDVPTLVDTVSSALGSVGREEEASDETQKPVPAVPVRKSVSGDYIVCLECGTRIAIMKRHLRTRHGLTEDEYKKRWELPANYPMVAANYSVKRSIMAKSFGLGKRRSGKS